MGTRMWVVIYGAPGIYFQILNYSVDSFVTLVLLSNSQQQTWYFCFKTSGMLHPVDW